MVDNINTNFPRGSLVATLTDSTTVDFWQSDRNEEVIYSFSAVQWPRSRVLSVSFTEGLSLSDTAISITPKTESLSFIDTVETVKDAKFSLTESLLFVEGSCTCR